jgi:capsular exopolysaccharide synthesis family protein
MLLQQLVDDYQTICTNIGFLNDSGDTKVITVTSPGMADGKTTFSVNMATSFVRSGLKTLLIDGDLRKPDVANLLNIPAERRRGLQNYFFDADIQKSVYKLDSMDFYVLAADDRNSGDAFILLSHPEMYYRIKLLRNHYDMIIIDTPPVLAFSDALVWARMSDGVILTSFIGHTSRVEMQEAVNRLNEVNVRILGTVVNNVKVSHNYRRYGYGYDYGTASQKKQEARRKRGPNALLLSESAGPVGDPSNTDV